MTNSAFGEMTFNIGWKAPAKIELFGQEFQIVLKAMAYFEEEGISSGQEKAYLDYSSKKKEKTAVIELLMRSYAADADTRFIPKTLLFEQDGAYALLCDDKNAPDEGIAVCLAPIEQILSQDDYL